MAEEYIRDADDQRARQRGVDAPQAGHGCDTSKNETADLSFASSLLGDLRLSGRSNGPTRAAAMLGMQGTHGNRAVQRAVAARSQPLPVQRGDEEDEQKPSFKPWLPELGLPFGGGWGFKGEGKGIGLNYKGGSASGGIGYDYGGGFTAEGGFKSPWGKGSLGLEFDPWKKEGSAGLKLGDFWMKGQYGEHGPALGFGYGNPFVTPPGFPANPGDPSKDWRKGELGPGMFGPPGDIEKNKKRWGIAGGFGPDAQGNPFPWLGFGGVF